MLHEKNEDILEIFTHYLKNSDSEFFLTSIEIKSED